MKYKCYVTMIKEYTFDSAQYLPSTFGKCNRLHGHTYTIRNLKIVTSKIVDFSLIKDVLKEFDHKILAPEKHRSFWEAIDDIVKTYALCEDKNTVPTFECVFIPADMVTVEELGEYIQSKLLEIDGIEDVSFELYETPKQGTLIC